MNKRQHLVVTLLVIAVIFITSIEGLYIDQLTLSTDYSFVGNAVQLGDVIQLTADDAYLAGRAIYDIPVDVVMGFSITISYNVSGINLDQGEGFSFVLTGDKSSFTDAETTVGNNFNIANMKDMAAVVLDMAGNHVLFCHVNSTTPLPLQAQISTECTSEDYADTGIGLHTMIITYKPDGDNSTWTVEIDGTSFIFMPGPLDIEPVQPNSYYFGWAASTGTIHADRTLVGWFANITDLCETNNGGCNENANCTSNGDGTVGCACLPGYEGDGIACTLIVEAPVAQPIVAPIAESIAPTTPAPSGPGADVLAPAIIIPVVVAGVAIFLGVYFGKKRQAKNKKKMNGDLENDDGTAALTATPQTTGIAPSNYGNVPSVNAAKGQYNEMPENIQGDGTYVSLSEINPTGINPSDVDKRMHIPYNSLVFVKEIGAGSYGKVFLGEWRGAEVAIKVNNTVTDMDGFLAEAKLTLGIAPHPNLVQTFGISLDGSYPCIVLEYCGGGSLDKLVMTNTAEASASISDAKRREFALKIAYGLTHLHNNNVVHRDLAARNILLSTEGQPKVSDFGMSRVIQDEVSKGKTKANVGPIRWMSPESLKDKTYSVKSDVWSYGILVWEIVAGREPHEEEDQLLVGARIRDEAFHPTIPDNCDPVLREVMEMCWKKDPAERPTMEEIAKHLRKS